MRMHFICTKVQVWRYYCVKFLTKMAQKNIVVFTGAGISAESGLRTFRDSDGLWEEYDIRDVATPEAWRRNPQLVLQFYNERRKKLLHTQPNPAHYALAELEKVHNVHIVTQNIDDLHERAGSSRVLHLHGELLKVRSERDPSLVYEWKKDLHWGDVAEDGAQLRPHVVWFGEPVDAFEEAVPLFEGADIAIIVGTSLQVYPAAGLIGFVPPESPIYYIDPRPVISYELQNRQNLHILAEKASTGVPKVVEELRKLA